MSCPYPMCSCAMGATPTCSAKPALSPWPQAESSGGNIQPMSDPYRSPERPGLSGTIWQDDEIRRLKASRDALAEQVEAVRALQRRDEREGPGYDWLIPKGYNQALDDIAAILEAK